MLAKVIIYPFPESIITDKTIKRNMLSGILYKKCLQVISSAGIFNINALKGSLDIAVTAINMEHFGDRIIIIHIHHGL
jgi:hypothetical protein